HQNAAAATLVALTAWQALVTNAKIQKNQKVLIHAASGGGGHIAVQVANDLGARVVGTSSVWNKDFVLKMGADQHINYHNYNWTDHPTEFDVVLDTTGGENIDHSLKVTNTGGSIISIPTGLNEQITQKAASQGVKAYFILVESSGVDMAKIATLLESGAIKPQIFKTYEFNQIKQAHLQQETGRTVGKLIITT